MAFNREEDGLLGSRDLVKGWKSGPLVREAHVLESVGFRSPVQGRPEGIPLKVPPEGDFLALLLNRMSSHLMKPMLGTAKACVPDLRVVGLRVMLGAERLFPDLLRSDHAPFWEAGMPAVLWTDTAEFRNPRYHTPLDVPESLDYRFLTDVTRLLACTLASG